MPSAKIIKPIQTEHSTEWHWWAFSDFCKIKAKVKEPSPHMQMIGLLTENRSLEDTIWFCGLYASFYNIPSALVMWKEWPWEIATEDRNQIETWLRANWNGLATRTERRAVRSVPKMNESILSYINWAEKELPRYLAYPDDPDTNAEAYDIIWQNADSSLRFMGRYIIIRLLEALHRFAGLKPHLYDIRSIGGWSPKRALGLLYPEHMQLLLSPDTKENVKKVDALAREAINRFSSEYGIPMSEYVFAAMLCEYRVCYENRHQYPGWTIDQEPAYWYKTKSFWDANRPPYWTESIEELFFGTRQALFPIENLGEINGWDGTRVQPRRVLRDYSYNWDDSVYNFSATTDFSKPVNR